MSLTAEQLDELAQVLDNHGTRDGLRAAYALGLAAGEEMRRDAERYRGLRDWIAAFPAFNAAAAHYHKAGMADAAKVCEAYFLRCRFDDTMHLGLGDIRLSIGAQEECAAAIRAEMEKA